MIAPDFYTSGIDGYTLTNWQDAVQVSHDEHGTLFLAASNSGARLLLHVLQLAHAWQDGDMNRYPQEALADFRDLVDEVASLTDGGAL